MKRILRIIAYVSFLALIAGYLFLPTTIENFNKKEGYSWEEYFPELALKLHTVDDIIAYTDSTSRIKNRHSLDYARYVSRTVSDRFFHGYSYYSFRHNWIAYLAGQVVWSDLDAIVIPNDILKHPNAACSQVSIVLAACLKKIGVPYRKVGLKGHFVLEASAGGKWYLFDANLEPHFPHGRKSLHELMQSGDLYQGYAGRRTYAELQNIFSRIEYGPVNAPLAPRATLFHRVTYVLSIFVAILLAVFVVADAGLRIYRVIQAKADTAEAANPPLTEERLEPSLNTQARP